MTTYDAAQVPSREEIREEITGVLCRCTGYENIVSAIEHWFAESAPIATGKDADVDVVPPATSRGTR